jgi:hypothetical protein
MMRILEEPRKILAATLSGRKLVPSKTLNILGIQIARVLAARCIQRLRPPRFLSSNRDLAKLRQDGILVIPEFLGDADFDELSREFHEIVAPLRQDHPFRIRPEQFRSRGGSRVMAFFENARLRHLLASAEKLPWDSIFHFNRLERTIAVDDVSLDSQAELHCDSFFHSHKAWLYINDVTARSSALCVIRGSHRLRLRQLASIYLHSCKLNVDASRRIADSELSTLPPVKRIHCERNTLVIVDTAIYHKRGLGQPGVARDALHVATRANPFSLCSGASAGLLSKPRQPEASGLF